MKGRAVRGVALVLLLGLTACGGGDGPIPVACGSVPPTDPDVLADTLELTVVLAERPTRSTEVLVRVDPLTERGAVLFSGTPPESAAAVSAALTTDAVFQGCINERADGFRLRAEEAPIGRVWVRVSSNRPVSVRLVTEAPGAEPRAGPPAASGPPGGPEVTATLVVPPGSSGRRAWPLDAPSGDRE